MERDVETDEIFSGEASDARWRSEPEKFRNGVPGQLRCLDERAPLVLLEKVEYPGRDRLCGGFEPPKTRFATSARVSP
jgi:hypothetical protein